MRRSSSIFLTLLSGSVCIPFSYAQTEPQLEEIIVTADYRQSSIDTISSSITVLNDALIQQKNAQHLEEVLLNAPNVNFASGASRARFYQIRGVGERAQYSAPLNSSVGVIIDGVDFSGAGNAAMLYDVEQVEILMGPQGTRYGSNALAGLINLQSKTPTEQQSYGLQLQSGNYASNGLAGFVSGPVTDNLTYRVSAQMLKSDGYSTNTFLQQDTNNRDEQTFRARLHWQAAEDLSLEFMSALVDLDNGYDAFSLDNIRDTQADEPGFDRQKSHLNSIKLTATQFDNFSLEGIVGYGDSDIEYGYDEDWVYTGFHPYEYSSTDQYFRNRETLSTEVRLLSNENGALLNGRTDWIVGVYNLEQEVNLERLYTFLPASFFSNFDISRTALFVDTTTELTSNWSVDFGLRAENFEASYTDTNLLNFNPDDTLTGGKLALNYQTDNNNLLYASISRGYKTGGFNTNGSLDADLREFDAEQLWNYEVGFKGFLLNDRLQTRAAFFYMDRDDVQISSSTVRMRDDGSAEFIGFIGNAAAGRNMGAEINLNFQATDSVQLYSSLGLLNTEYRNFINSAGDNLDGREQAHAPGSQYTLGFDWSINPDLALNINIQGRDKFYFSDSHDIQSSAYSLINASVQYQWQNVKVTLWGRNLGDRDYQVRGFYFGNDPRDDYTAKGYTQLGEPLLYGLKLDWAIQ